MEKKKNHRTSWGETARLCQPYIAILEGKTGEANSGRMGGENPYLTISADQEWGKPGKANRGIADHPKEDSDWRDLLKLGDRAPQEQDIGQT